jgi:K+ transporter
VKQDHRSYPKLSPEELHLCLSMIQNIFVPQKILFSKEDWSHLKKIFFILSYIQNESLLFEATFLKLFHPHWHGVIPVSIQILHLTAFQKQIIKTYKKQGQPLPNPVLQQIDHYLRSAPRELQFWLLQVLYEIQGSLLLFKSTLLHIRPRFWQLFIPSYNRLNPIIQEHLEKIYRLEKSSLSS